MLRDSASALDVPGLTRELVGIQKCPCLVCLSFQIASGSRQDDRYTHFLYIVAGGHTWNCSFYLKHYLLVLSPWETRDKT